jgi:Cupredoxin-like domain
MAIRIRLTVILLAVVLSGFEPALAQESFTIVFKDHRIVPAELQVPAGQKFTLIVDNQDASPEEFESHSLKREKVVPGKSKATIRMGPLKPGTYEIFGEYHESTAQGRIVAK